LSGGHWLACRWSAAQTLAKNDPQTLVYTELACIHWLAPSSG